MVRHEDVWQPGKGRSPPQETEPVGRIGALAADSSLSADGSDVYMLSQLSLQLF